MSEWFYIQRWKANSSKIWVVVDDDMNLCTPIGEFYDHHNAQKIAEELKGGNLLGYSVIHNQSQEYTHALRNSEVKNENKRNEQSG